MRKIAIVCKTTNEIRTTYDAPEINQKLFGGPWGDSSKFEHILIPVSLEAEDVSTLFPDEVQVQDGTKMELQGNVDAKDGDGDPILGSDGMPVQVPDYNEVPNMVTVRGFRKL